MKKISFDQFEISEVSNKTRYFSIIESLLFISGEPLKLKQIASIIECSIQFTENLLNEMMTFYVKSERGLKLICINEEYQFVTKSENSAFIQKLLKTNVRQSLSQASLETIAIIAYKQPITRIDIDEIRGVKSDRAILTLQEKNLIEECGRLDVPGRPILYRTTEEFLRHFDLESLNQLPSLEQFISDIKLDVEDEVAIDNEH